MSGPRLGRIRLTARSGHGASILVASLSAAFGVVLLMATDALSTYIRATSLAEHGSVRLALLIVAAVFIVIAVYVGAIVTTNTFATIVAGRTRTLALMRLIGASSGRLRASVAREGLLVGCIGSALGAVLGYALAVAGTRAVVGWGMIPERDYPTFDPLILIPPVVVIATTWLASWVGSRRVLAVTPLQALGTSVERSNQEAGGRRGRNVAAGMLFSVGAGLLVAGILLGLVTPFGVMIALLGGVLSFSGLVLGAHLVMPPVLRLVGRLAGGSASARLAAANAVRYPERSARTAIGLVIGVTLVTMFSVAAQCYQNVLIAAQAARPDVYSGAGIDPVLTATIAVFSILVGFSAVIAAVGMVNSLSLSVFQRRRELGLLRALGFSSNQVRALVFIESAQLSVAAVVTGVVLGIFYGWAGAQSLLGSLPGGGLIAPSVPWLVLAVAAAACALLAVVASIAPTRRAVRTSPMAALAVE
jgi:putative ABC transport system permease protein